MGREHWFARSEAAGRLGLHAAIGFPVRVGEQALGVIELYSDRVEPPDESLLETLADICSQIGLYLGGREAAEGARRRRPPP